MVQFSIPIKNILFRLGCGVQMHQGGRGSRFEVSLVSELVLGQLVCTEKPCPEKQKEPELYICLYICMCVCVCLYIYIF